MYQSKKILSFIGARGGSKGLRNKNIMNLVGKPLIAWTIEASVRSRYIDRTIVSTDSPEIARMAKTSGADVPFLRPAELATDTAAIILAMQHCLQWLEKNEGQSYDYILRLQPTSPLRTVEHVDEAIRHYFQNKKSDKDTLVSVMKAPDKVGWLMEKKNSYVDFHFKLSAGQKMNRQSLPRYYLPTGAIYVGPVAVIKKSKTDFYTGHVLPFEMDGEISMDIDTVEDFAEVAKIMETKITLDKDGKPVYASDY